VQTLCEPPPPPTPAATQQDPNSNDCAKAKLNMCMKQDKLCVPMQMGSDPVALAAYARESCPVSAPKESGVQVRGGSRSQGLALGSVPYTQPPSLIFTGKLLRIHTPCSLLLCCLSPPLPRQPTPRST